MIWGHRYFRKHQYKLSLFLKGRYYFHRCSQSCFFSHMEQFQNVHVGCQGNTIDCIDGYHWFLLIIISGRPTNPSISHQVDGDLLSLAKSQILPVRKSYTGQIIGSKLWGRGMHQNRKTLGSIACRVLNSDQLYTDIIVFFLKVIKIQVSVNWLLIIYLYNKPTFHGRLVVGWFGILLGSSGNVHIHSGSWHRSSRPSSPLWLWCFLPLT